MSLLDGYKVEGIRRIGIYYFEGGGFLVKKFDFYGRESFSWSASVWFSTEFFWNLDLNLGRKLLLRTTSHYFQESGSGYNCSTYLKDIIIGFSICLEILQGILSSIYLWHSTSLSIWGKSGQMNAFTSFHDIDKTLLIFENGTFSVFKML